MTQINITFRSLDIRSLGFIWNLGFGHWNLNYCEMIIRTIEESADKEGANGSDQTVVD
jgi:hypothetical protein